MADDWDYADWAQEAGERYEQDAILSKSVLADTLLDCLTFLVSNFNFQPKDTVHRCDKEIRNVKF